MSQKHKMRELYILLSTSVKGFWFKMIVNHDEWFEESVFSFSVENKRYNSFWTFGLYVTRVFRYKSIVVIFESW